MATHYTTDNGRTWDYITLDDAAVRVSFHLFDLDREDLTDGILDVLGDICTHDAPDPTDERLMLAFMARIQSIQANDAIDVVCKALDKLDSGLSPILAQLKDL